jgi:hypothetical protein
MIGAYYLAACQKLLLECFYLVPCGDTSGGLSLGDSVQSFVYRLHHVFFKSGNTCSSN